MKWTDVVPQAPARPVHIGAVAALTAGQLAGLLMAGVWMASQLLLEKSLWEPFRLITSALPHPGPVPLNAWTVLIGLTVHQLGPALFWSMIFAVGVESLRVEPGVGPSLALGAAVGGLALLVDVYLLLPPLLQEAQAGQLWRQQVPRALELVLHLGFGLSLGGAYYLLRERSKARLDS